MADVTLLHWNIETYGPSKFLNGNNTHFINYIASLVDYVDADIFSMVEVKNSISAQVPGLVADDVNIIQGILPANNPWRSVRVNSGYNNEAYIIMYRTDRNFLPANSVGGNVNSGAAVNPENALWSSDTAGLNVPFPSRWTPRGGRKPYYCTFESNNMTAETFSVLSYHAMFGAHTPYGVWRLPELSCITEFATNPYPDIDGSLIAGDFNVDYAPPPGSWYDNIIALPSVNATTGATSLMNNPGGGPNPANYLANAYDNIFQKIPAGGLARVGTVVDLMVQSSVLPGAIPPVPAGAGNLSAAAGAFNPANIPNNWAFNPVLAVPPADMPSAWGFVREAISNHYPVVVTTRI